MQAVSNVTTNFRPKIIGIPGNPPPRKVKPTARVWKLSDLDTDHNPKIAVAVNVARKRAQRKRDGVNHASVVLCGSVGVGKTHIARAILWSICYTDDDGNPVAPVGRFYTADDLIVEAGDTAPRDFLPKTLPVLVIDDIGTEKGLKYVAKENQAAEIQRRYESVINWCYTNEISVIITSNFELRKLEAHLGPRVWDRLCAMAEKGLIFDMGSVPSYRQVQGGRA